MENASQIQSENTPSLYFTVDEKGQLIGTYWKAEGAGCKAYAERQEIEQAERPLYFNDAGQLDFGKLRLICDARERKDKETVNLVNDMIDAAAEKSGKYPATALRNFKRVSSITALNNKDGIVLTDPVDEWLDAFCPRHALKAWQGKTGLALNPGEKPLRRDKGDILPAYVHDALAWHDRYDAELEKLGYASATEAYETASIRAYEAKQALRRAPAVTLEQVAYKAAILSYSVIDEYNADKALAASLAADIQSLGALS